MHGIRRSGTITHSLVFVVGLAVFSGVLAGPAHAGEHKAVELNIMTNRTFNLVITVDPSYAKIWRNKAGKPKKIKWITDNDSPYNELFWELRYDPSKGGGTADYFGDVDIECGETSIKVQPDKKPDFANAEWPYSVTVYACFDGMKGRELATADPRIVWKD